MTYPLVTIIAVVTLLGIAIYLSIYQQNRKFRSQDFVALDDYIQDLSRDKSVLLDQNEALRKEVRMLKAVSNNLKSTTEELFAAGKELQEQIVAAVRAIDALESEVVFLKNPPDTTELTSDDLDTWSQSAEEDAHERVQAALFAADSDVHVNGES